MNVSTILTVRFARVLLAGAAAAVSLAYSQTVSNTAIYGPTPPALFPTSEAREQSLSGAERIDLYSGHAGLAIPVRSIGGRGEAGYTMTVAASNPPWAIENQAFLNNSWLTGNAYFSFLSTAIARWWHPYRTLYTPGYVVIKRSFEDLRPCDAGGTPFYRNTYTHLVFLAPDGSETPLYSTANEGPNSHDCGLPAPDLSRGTEFRSRVSSGMWFQSDESASWCTDASARSEIYDENDQNLDATSHYADNVCGTLNFRNGVRYLIDGGRVRRIVDRNGNASSLAYCGEPGSACTGNMLLEKVTDPVGRQTTINYQGCSPAAGQECHTITYPGTGGASRTISVLWGPPGSRLRADLTAQTPFADLGAAPLMQTGLSVYSITLPDNRAFSFYYNSYGETARMVLPAGGAVDYEYGSGISNAPAAGAYASGQVFDSVSDIINGTSTPPWSPYVYRRLLKRREHTSNPGSTATTLLDGIASSVTTYTTAETASNPDYFPGTTRVSALSITGGPLTVTTTGAGGAFLQQTHSFSPASPAFQLSTIPGFGGPPDPYEGIEAATETPGMQRTERVYTTTADHVAVVCQQRTTVLPAGIASQMLSVYGAYSNLTDSYEYGYGAGPALGTNCPSASAGYSRHTHIDYVTGSPYLPSLPLQETVKNESDAVVSDTKYEYDAGTPTARPSMTGYASGDALAIRGNRTSTSRWNGTAWVVTGSAEYDVAGNVTVSRDAKQNATSYLYDSTCTNTYAFLSRVTDPLGGAVNYDSWDCNSGKPTQMRDVNTAITQLTYADSLDRLTNVVRAAGETEATETAYGYYDSTKTLATFQDLNSRADRALRTESLYDGLGRTVETRQYEGAGCTGTVTKLDGLGRPWKVSNPYRANPCATPADGSLQFTVYSYDGLGRVLDVVAPDGSTATTRYAGNQTTITDAAGKIRVQETDGLGRLTKVLDGGASGYETRYQYDAMDRLRYVYQGGESQASRTFTYDFLGRLTSAENIESGTTAYAYDLNGNLTLKTDARGVKTCFGLWNGTQCDASGYDALNRVLRKTYSDTTAPVTYTWDTTSLRRLYSVANSASTQQFDIYDKLGRVKRSTQHTGTTDYVFNYTYNLAGLPLTRQYAPSGRTVTYGYDSAGRLNAVSGSVGGVPKTYVSSVSYAPHGGIQQLAFGNGLTESTTFNNRLQPVCMTAGSLLTLKAKYTAQGTDPCMATGTDNNGNVRQATVIAGSVTMTQDFTYDAVNRLETAGESGGWAQRYVYDGRGNRALLSGSGQYVPGQSLTPQVAQTTPEAVAAIFPSNRWTGATHDSAGNQTGLPVRTFGYDAENRVTQATTSGTTVGTYGYDGEGRRVTSTVGGNTTVFVYDAFGQLAAEHRAQVSAPPCTTCYLTADHLGSTRLVTDQTGAVKERHDFLPFGEEIPAGIGPRTVGIGYTSGEDVRQKFTGKERDAETGLDYFGARYFSGAQGRFTSTDPENASASLFNPQAWNAYSYALNNPYKYVDPDGEVPLLVTGAIGAGIGAAGGAGFSLVSQLISNGGDFSQIDYRQVGSAALGGAVQGGLAGLTLGVGTAAVGIGEAALANGAANVIGGIVTRGTNELIGVPQASNAPSEATAAAVDFAMGAVGGGYGARQANVRYPLPNVRKELAIIANSNRRSLRPAKVQAFTQYANQQQIRNTVSGSVIGTSVMGFFTDLFFRAGNVFNPSPVQAKKKKKDYETDITITYGLPE